MSGPQNYCQACGAGLGDADRCPDCGREVSTKSAVLAALLSLLVTGTGHLYLGAVTRGVAWFLGSAAIAVFLAVVVPEATILAFGLPFAAAIDAYAQASSPAGTVG